MIVDASLAIFWLRVVKILAACLFAGGVFASAVADDFPHRRKAAYQLAAPGFALSWILGFLLMWLRGENPTQGWIWISLFSSMTSFQIVLFVGSKEGRGGRASSSIAIACVLLTIFLMSVKPF